MEDRYTEEPKVITFVHNTFCVAFHACIHSHNHRYSYKCSNFYNSKRYLILLIANDEHSHTKFTNEMINIIYTLLKHIIISKNGLVV